MYEDILDLAYEHAGDEYRKVLIYYWGDNGSTIYTEYEEGILRAFLFYTPLVGFDYDMVCVTDRYNNYTLNTWKQLSKLLKNRTKEIRIDSKTRHPAIQKAISRYGGYRDGDTLIFVKE